MFAQYVEEAICQKQATLLHSGALAVDSGFYKGRASHARFIVDDDLTHETIDWGEMSRKFPEERAREFFRTLEFKLSQARSFEVSGFIGPFAVNLKTSSAWHAAFAELMFRETILAVREYAGRQTFKIWHAPELTPEDFNLKGGERAFVLIDPKHCSIGIIGTAYAGEIKKAAFSLANSLLVDDDILPLHAAATCDSRGESTSLLIGLSGTGKTALALQPGASCLIGDDEIIWSRSGLSNLEGGVYAKTAELQPQREAAIWSAANRFGTLLENVSFDDRERIAHFGDQTKSENGRAAISLRAFKNVFDQNRESGAPDNIVLLMADATGALPAVGRLNPAQAAYHFLSGYTAKISGTEAGISEPKLTFSPTFGAPFMPRHKESYVQLFQKRLKQTRATLWLLNTGWPRGSKNGPRFPIELTHRILELIQSGSLEREPTLKHGLFGFEVPLRAEGVPAEFLRVPEGPQVLELVKAFILNEKKFTSSEAVKTLKNGGPRLSRGARKDRDAVFPVFGNSVVNDFK